MKKQRYLFFVWYFMRMTYETNSLWPRDSFREDTRLMALSQSSPFSSSVQQKSFDVPPSTAIIVSSIGQQMTLWLDRLRCAKSQTSCKWQFSLLWLYNNASFIRPQCRGPRTYLSMFSILHSLEEKNQKVLHSRFSCKSDPLMFSYIIIFTIIFSTVGINEANGVRNPDRDLCLANLNIQLD